MAVEFSGFRTLLSHVVRGIMVENKLNVYNADKSIKFGREVRFGILAKKKFGPRQNPPMTLIKMRGNISNIFNFSPKESNLSEFDGQM